jgi:hypothetical protein
MLWRSSDYADQLCFESKSLKDLCSDFDKAWTAGATAFILMEDDGYHVTGVYDMAVQKYYTLPTHGSYDDYIASMRAVQEETAMIMTSLPLTPELFKSSRFLTLNPSAWDAERDYLPVHTVRPFFQRLSADEAVDTIRHAENVRRHPEKTGSLEKLLIARTALKLSIHKEVCAQVLTQLLLHDCDALREFPSGLRDFLGSSDGADVVRRAIRAGKNRLRRMILKPESNRNVTAFLSTVPTMFPEAVRDVDAVLHNTVSKRPRTQPVVSTGSKKRKSVVHYHDVDVDVDVDDDDDSDGNGNGDGDETSTGGRRSAYEIGRQKRRRRLVLRSS